MPLTNGGALLLANALFGATITPYNAANAIVGVGDSTTAFAKTQTALQATTNVAYQAMDAGFPTQAGTTLTYQATFAPGAANFPWNEIGLFNAASGGGIMLNRMLQSNGTKTNNQYWTLQVIVTLAN